MPSPKICLIMLNTSRVVWSKIIRSKKVSKGKNEAFGQKGPVRQSVETSLASLEQRAMTDSTEGKDERRFAAEGSTERPPAERPATFDRMPHWLFSTACLKKFRPNDF